MENNINEKLLKELSDKLRKDGIEKVLAGAVILFEDIRFYYQKDVPTGTLRAIISQVGLTVKEFLNFKKE